MENASEVEKIVTESPTENPGVNYSFQRTLKMQGLMPTDYFLYKEIRDHFGFDNIRTVLIFGLRWIYSCCYDPVLREKMRVIAGVVQKENLSEHKEMTYNSISQIVKYNPAIPK
jgi:hypothetical protein